jgi:hypothetical protein
LQVFGYPQRNERSENAKDSPFKHSVENRPSNNRNSIKSGEHLTGNWSWCSVQPSLSLDWKSFIVHL